MKETSENVVQPGIERGSPDCYCLFTLYKCIHIYMYNKIKVSINSYQSERGWNSVSRKRIGSIHVYRQEKLMMMMPIVK